jgi:RES domain-containing protein
MEVYRLSREKFAKPLSGKGAAQKGARWNSIGVELIYAAVNRSLAMAEVAVHLTLATIPDDYVMLTIFIPASVFIKKMSVKDLPKDWNSFPPPNATQLVGGKFVLENKYCVLQIPSAATQDDYNLLINPNHTDFKKIKIRTIEKFPFDKRIFK